MRVLIIEQQGQYKRVGSVEGSKKALEVGDFKKHLITHGYLVIVSMKCPRKLLINLICEK